jgi:hypothetical protein
MISWENFYQIISADIEKVPVDENLINISKFYLLFILSF